MIKLKAKIWMTVGSSASIAEDKPTHMHTQQFTAIYIGFYAEWTFIMHFFRKLCTLLNITLTSLCARDIPVTSSDLKFGSCFS